MKNNVLLHQLHAKIAQLAEEMAPIVSQQSHYARFDVQLFHCHSTRLGDYLAVLQQHYQQLQQSVQDNHTEQVNWLAERMVAQIAALRREIATLHMRKKNEKNILRNDKSLYEKRAEHQQFERRLHTMITDREKMLSQQESLSQQRKLQQEIAVLAGRLQRCRQALKRIEQDIEQSGSQTD
ncbi:primosomal replication protein PriC [Enterobacteriaceae bacterium LUAb1]